MISTPSKKTYFKAIRHVFFRWKTGIVLKGDLGIEWVEILLIDRVYHQKVGDFEATKIDGNTMGDTEKPM